MDRGPWEEFRSRFSLTVHVIFIGHWDFLQFSVPRQRQPSAFWPGTGNWVQSSETDPRIRRRRASSSGARSTSRIQPPIVRICSEPHAAGGERRRAERMPEGSTGLRGSKGIMFLLTVMPQRPSAVSACSRSGRARSRRPASGGCRCRR